MSTRSSYYAVPAIPLDTRADIDAEMPAVASWLDRAQGCGARIQPF